MKLITGFGSFVCVCPCVRVYVCARARACVSMRARVFVFLSREIRHWHRKSRGVNTNSRRFYRVLNPEWGLVMLRHV